MIDALARMNDLAKRAANQVLQTDSDPLTPEAEEAILDEVRPVVQQFLLLNLLQCGLHRRTGRLQDAVRNANVWISRSKSGKSVKLMIGFKAGMGGDRHAKDPDKRPVYTYGSAQNYGAVYQHHGLGERARRKLKREVVRQNSRIRPTTRGSQYKLQHYGRAILVNRGHKHGGVTVIPPRNFFKLNSQQTAQVAAIFQAALIQYAANKQRTA